MSKNKKNTQLGMNAGTAAHRLKIDLLFDFVIKAGHKCFRCGEELTRDTFSIDHKISWLDSENPVVNFFDISNIAYSHMICNFGAAKKSNQKYFSKEDMREHWREEWNKRKDRRNAVRRPQRRKGYKSATNIS